MTDKEAILGFDQSNQTARESLLEAGDGGTSYGLANPHGIILDASALEENLPRILSLFQVRILLAFGATHDSSNVNETRQEELEKLITNFTAPLSRNGEVADDESRQREETKLVSKAPYLAVSILEALL